MFALVLIGFVFNYVDVKSKNLCNFWIIHILADSATVLIGLRLFNFI
jgi:CAAX protease family protein